MLKTVHCLHGSPGKLLRRTMSGVVPIKNINLTAIFLIPRKPMGQTWAKLVKWHAEVGRRALIFLNMHICSLNTFNLKNTDKCFLKDFILTQIWGYPNFELVNYFVWEVSLSGSEVTHCLCRSADITKEHGHSILCTDNWCMGTYQTVQGFLWET